MYNSREFYTSNSWEEEARPLASTPPSWPDYASAPNLNSDARFVGNYQNRTTYNYPAARYNSLGNEYPSNVNFTNDPRQVNEQPLQYGANDAEEEAKAATKLSNRESKAREREYNERVKCSHLANDKLIEEIKRGFLAWHGIDPYIRGLFKRLVDRYNFCPLKPRKQRELRRPPKNDTSNKIPTSSGASSTANLPSEQVATYYDNDDYYRHNDIISYSSPVRSYNNLYITNHSEIIKEDDHLSLENVTYGDLIIRHTDIKPFLTPPLCSNVSWHNSGGDEEDTDSHSSESASEISATTLLFGGLLGLFAALTLNALENDDE